MIRKCVPADMEIIKDLHAHSNLPEECLPDLNDPLFLHKAVLENEGKIVMGSFLRGAGEIYLLVDHGAGTPEDRWKWLQELKEYMVHEAWLLGLDHFSAWVPPDIEESFAKRLEALGFIKSPWSCYTLPIPKQL
jgi:hypothetical protein